MTGDQHEIAVCPCCDREGIGDGLCAACKVADCNPREACNVRSADV